MSELKPLEHTRPPYSAQDIPLLQHHTSSSPKKVSAQPSASSIQNTNSSTSAHTPPHSDHPRMQSVSKGKSLTNEPFREEGDYRFVSVGGSLIPPTNFGIIEEDLYRSGMPNELNFPFLERLQLRTIIYLASDEVSDKLYDFIDDQDIVLMQLAQDDDIPTPWKPISEETVLSALELLLDTSTYPVYIMCSQGRHRTGTVVGCLRKLQRWSLSIIFEEYHRHADGKGRLVNEQFIELFDTDLINIPSTNIPKWLT